MLFTLLVFFPSAPTSLHHSLSFLITQTNVPLVLVPESLTVFLFSLEFCSIWAVGLRERRFVNQDIGMVCARLAVPICATIASKCELSLFSHQPHYQLLSAIT